MTDETSERMTNSEASRATFLPASSPISRCARVMREVSSCSHPDSRCPERFATKIQFTARYTTATAAVPISIARGTVCRGSRNSSAA